MVIGRLRAEVDGQVTQGEAYKSRTWPRRNSLAIGAAGGSALR